MSSSVVSWPAHTDFSGGRSGDLVFPSLSEFSIVYCDTVKGFGIVNKAEVDVFLELLLFWWSNGCWQFELWFLCVFQIHLNFWKFTVHILLKPGLENFEHYFASVWVKSLSRVWLFVTPWTVAHQAPPSMEFSRQEYWSGLLFPSPGGLPDPGIKPRSSALQADDLASHQGSPASVWAGLPIPFLWDWNENWPFPVLWPLLSFQICWHSECSTFTVSSFRIWISSTLIPSPPLALFIVMLPKATWLHIPGCLALGEWSHHCGYLGHDLFLYSSSVYSCHLFLISSASVRRSWMMVE